MEDFIFTDLDWSIKKSKNYIEEETVNIVQDCIYKLNAAPENDKQEYTEIIDDNHDVTIPNDDRKIKQETMLVAEDEIFLGPQCNDLFPPKRDLDSHQKVFHEDNEKSKRQSQVRRKKVKLEEDEGTWLCPLCGKQFQSKKKLYSHKETFHSEGEVLCNICGKPFKHKYYLRAHIRFVHVNISIDNHHNFLKCDQCDKSFKNQSNLYNHKKFVHEFMPGLVCSFCLAPARHKYALRKHMRKCMNKDPSERKLHGGKPGEFQCIQCSYSSDTKKKLRLHINFVHDISPTQCQLCYKRFKNYTTVRQHLLRTHNQGPQPDLYLFLGDKAKTEMHQTESEINLLNGTDQ